MDVSVSIIAKIFKKTPATIHNWLIEPSPRFAHHLDVSGHKKVHFKDVQNYIEQKVLFDSINKTIYKQWLEVSAEEVEKIICPHCSKAIHE